MVFVEGSDACAGIDFQYVGGSVGSRDLSKWIMKAYDFQKDCDPCYEQEILKCYFEALSGKLKELYSWDMLML
jgi:hypothetical protein